MIRNLTVLEVYMTPRLLRLYADRLEKEMAKTTTGQDLPVIIIKDWDSKTEIRLIADQDAFHRKNKGEWS